MNQNEIINTVAKVERASCFRTQDGKLLIGMTMNHKIIVCDGNNTNIVTLGRFRNRVELYRFLRNQ